MAEPVCRHFGVCGGCQLQGLDAADYESRKLARLAPVLALNPQAVAPLATSPPGVRRRLRLGFQRTRDQVLVGHRQARSKKIVDLHECPISQPEVVTMVGRLRELLSDESVCWSKGEVSLTAFGQALDVVILAEPEPDLATREALALWAPAVGVARIGWQPSPTHTVELLLELTKPRLSYGSLAVIPALGGFLQASPWADDRLRAIVSEALEGCESVAECHAGTGTLTLALLKEGKRVAAFERDESALKALAALSHPRLTWHQVDLERTPPKPGELEGFDAVLLDPPRAGAERLCQSLDESGVDRIIYVSCEPKTLARDGSRLTRFELTKLQPVDQFLYADHLECVARFDRVRPLGS
ncbi:MAG: class I SAM-dependent RNA methyltransferase [Geminicoccaceae bacterium]